VQVEVAATPMSGIGNYFPRRKKVSYFSTIKKLCNANMPVEIVRQSRQQYLHFYL
jgi:hypothetical protein